MLNVGFVGLGVMGCPMAGHLLHHQQQLVVWNRTAGKSHALREQGATVAESLPELASKCQTIFLCVSRTEDVLQCAETIMTTAQPDTLIIDHSTILPKAAEELHGELASRGLRFIDAPITGGSVGAQKGQLTIFCGGSSEDIDEALPLMRIYAKKAERVGGPGAGQLTKMANQIAVAGSLLALCESLSFAEKAGLDVAKTRDLLAGGAAGSWAFDNYGPKILSRDWTPGFKVKDQAKDLIYCIQTAQDLGAAVPGSVLVNTLLENALAAGWGEQTTAILYELLLQSGVAD